MRHFAWTWKFTITYCVVAGTFLAIFLAGNHG